MVRQQLFIFLLVVVLPDDVSGQIQQWRGPNRDGIYSETGLMKKWPADGPDLIWSFEGLGSGHGSVGIGRDKLFILGLTGTDGILYAFDFSGKLLWKRNYGPEWHVNYIGPRGTPVVIDNRVYFESGHGTIYCYDSDTGGKLWSVDLLKRFDATNIEWGMAESLLISGDFLYSTPGGKEHNVVALDRLTGETIWTSPGNGQPAAYCSPLLVRHNKANLLVTMTSHSVIGIDALTGEFYWQVPQFQRNKIHANTPVYSDGIIYCSSEGDNSNSGLVALKLSDDGKSVAVKWRNQDFRNLMGGIIVTGGHIYGSVYRRGLWSCVNKEDGATLYSSRALGDGNIIMADGLFYCYSEKGEMALVSGTPSSFDVISKFQITMGTDPHWSHPVIYQGRMYLRHGDALMVYNLKAR